MNKAEILEFLELTPAVTDADICRRAKEKKAFFERLLQSAPNAVLKKIHLQNLENTNSILQTYGAGIDESPVPPVLPKAWLVRHTENTAIKSFQLKEGKNLIGREGLSGYNLITIENDSYVSRQHAVLELVLHPEPKAYISDGLHKPSKNGTYLNGNSNSIQGKTLLAANDTIQIGMTKLIFKVDKQESLQRVEREVEETEYMKTVIINL